MPDRKLESRQNPIIQAVAKLRTSRGRQQAGKIIIDGQREISRAIIAGISLDSIFLPDDDHDWQLTKADSVYSVSQRAHEKIAYGKRLEPVAVANRPTTSLAELSVTDDALFVVLEAVEKPGNIGAIMRSADATGVTNMILVDPLADAFNPNAIRASLGTIFALNVATASYEEYREWANRHGICSVLAICDSEAKEYTMHSFAGKSAIVLGNEANGLSDNWRDLDKAERIFLPMRGIADSLNVSSAATVLLYAATGNRILGSKSPNK